MPDITRILSQIESGDPSAAEKLLPLVYLDRLRAEEPIVADIVNLRYFAGLTIEQAAAATRVSVRTANRHWAYAKAWLFENLR